MSDRHPEDVIVCGAGRSYNSMKQAYRCLLRPFKTHAGRQLSHDGWQAAAVLSQGERAAACPSFLPFQPCEAVVVTVAQLELRNVLAGSWRTTRCASSALPAVSLCYDYVGANIVLGAQVEG
jgi:hypothetical protein